MRGLIVTVFKTVLVAVVVAAASSLGASAQSGTYSISGTVYEYTADNDSVPVKFALVAIPDYGIAASTDIDGKYTLRGVPRGKAVVKASYVGKVTGEVTVDVTRSLTVDFNLKDENFKLKEVMVTAQMTQAGGATSSLIGRNAMDHMQTTSLSDVMALLPGNVSTEPNLSGSKNIQLRSVGGDASSMNALGTAIIRDGAPMSNNANLSVLGATAEQNGSGAGGTPPAHMSGSSSPGAGTDLRSISTDNIESIEVIRGIPSVEHGDLTAGAVLINSKAGREPLRITAKANPKVYMGSVSTGFNLGHNRGGLNINADYAHNTNDPVESYRTYQRMTARVMYSKEFKSSLRSNTSLNFVYGKDNRALNPDDTDNMRASHAKDYGVTFNTNGLWSINKGWLKSLRYVASGTYTSRQSYYQEIASSNNTPYSGVTTDGTVLSNTAGQHLFDNLGNEITNFTDATSHYAAYCLPANYFSWNTIDSREVNVFAKAVATLFKQTGYVNNRILVGADFRSDGNVGHGKNFDPLGPPQRAVTVPNASWRSRDYRDVPFLNQVGAFAEENFTWQAGLHELRLQAGVRYDHANRVGGQWSPRFNGSFEILPNKLWIRGGYGVTAKMPTIMHLFPEKAYFEYINVNEMPSTAIPEDQKLYVTTTKVYDVNADNLKIATNRKAEVGIDLRLGRNTFTVTGFYEKLKNGYSIGKTLNSCAPFEWTTYKRADAESPLISQGTYNVLSWWYAPGNDLWSQTRGVEFDFSFARFEKINTSLSVNGAWMRGKSRDAGLEFYDPTMNMTGDKRQDVAIYAGNTAVTHNENFVTAVRITHNLPRIGFVVTLTGQTVWKNASWTRFNGDVLPIGYMSLADGQPHYFEADKWATEDDFKADPDYGFMWREANHRAEIRESYHPYFCFNMNVTKELGEMMRVSFFANNMFRSYPRRQSDRNLGGYYLMNNRFYFGVEMQITL